MPQALLCPSCGSALTGGEPKGLCPRCLIKRGMEAHTAGYTESGAVAKGWEPPTPAELAGQFEAVEVLELLGRGGMGAVYRARQKQLDRIVALKILPPGIGHDPAFAERFTREAKALARLNHPNIVTLYEFGRTGAGLYYFLMEYVDGVSLRRLMEDGRVAPREALAIVPQVCDALQYAHDQGIVHRDIKPENVLLDRRGRVKVADFGLAKIVGQDENPPGAEAGGASGANTEAGRVVGTPQYMAPEQAGNPGEVDHRSDIYALGVVFYQMLTGELPGRPVEAPSRRIHFDVRLDEVVLRALEREPRLRYAQASEMKTQVELIANTPPAEGDPIKPLEHVKARIPVKRRKMNRIALGALAIVLLVTVGTQLADRHFAERDAAAIAAASELKIKQDADAAEQVKLKKDAEVAEQLKIKHGADVEQVKRVEMNNNLEQLKLNYQGQILDITDRMTRIATKLAAAGVGVNDRGNSKEIELQELIVEQLRVIATLGATDAKLKTFEKQMETDSAPELDEACQRSPLYADYRHQYDDLNLSYNELVATSGAENAQSVALKHRLDSAQKRLSETENAIKTKTAELIRSNLANDRNIAQQALVRIEKRLADIRSEIADFTKDRSEYDHLAGRLAHLRDRLDRVMDEQDRVGYGLPSDKGK